MATPALAISCLSRIGHFLAGFWDKRLGVLSPRIDRHFIATVTIIPFMAEERRATHGRIMRCKFTAKP
jgi:hypothetical protein